MANRTETRIAGDLHDEGAVRHDGGVVPLSGMYVLGLPFVRNGRSCLIDGVGRDAEAPSEHLLGHLAVGRSR
jgi:putative flavoprotein involved in K+ transport